MFRNDIKIKLRLLTVNFISILWSFLNYLNYIIFEVKTVYKQILPNIWINLTVSCSFEIGKIIKTRVSSGLCALNIYQRMERKEGRLNIYLIYWQSTHTVCPFCYSHRLSLSYFFPFLATYISNFPRNSISLKSIPYQNNNKWGKFAVYENKKRWKFVYIFWKSHGNFVHGTHFTLTNQITVRSYWFWSLFPRLSGAEVRRAGWKPYPFCAHVTRDPFLLHFNLMWKTFSPFSWPSFSTLLFNLWEMKWKYFRVLFLTVSDSFSTCSLWLSKLIIFS